MKKETSVSLLKPEPALEEQFHHGLKHLNDEGTRAKVKEWKTGFLRIASEIKADIVPASLDFKKKEILLGEIFKPSGDNTKDILDLKKYYSVFAPKHPEKF